MKRTLPILFLGLFCAGILTAGIIKAEVNPNFIGNSNTKKYHCLTCRYVPLMNVLHIRYFTSPKEAELAGYIPCKICRPDLDRVEEKTKTLFAKKES